MGRRNLGEFDLLFAWFHDEAAALANEGYTDGALLLLQEQERICRELGKMEGLTVALINQAILMRNSKQSPAQGLPLVEEGLRIATAHGLTELARQCERIRSDIRMSLP